MTGAIAVPELPCIVPLKPAVAVRVIGTISLTCSVNVLVATCCGTDESLTVTVKVTGDAVVAVGVPLTRPVSPSMPNPTVDSNVDGLSMVYA